MLQNQGFQYRKLLIIIYTGFEDPIPPNPRANEKGENKRVQLYKILCFREKKKKEKVK